MKTKQALYNLMANIAFQVITTLVGIILPPIIIKTYGSEVNGMVSSIKQFIAYLQLVEAGVGVASITALYGPLAKDDTNSINSILSATKSFYKKSGILFATLIGILSIVYPIIIRNQIEFPIALLMVLILGGTTIAEYFLIGKYRVLLVAEQKNYIMLIVQIVATILNFVTALILIRLNSSIVIVHLFSTLIFSSRYFYILFYVKRHYHNISFDSEPNNEAISQKWDVLIHQVAALVTINTPIVLLTIFFTLKEVSVYSIYNFVFSAVSMIVGCFSSGLMPGFGQVIAKGDKNTMNRAFSTYEFVYYTILFWAYSCAAILIMPFILFYTSSITDTNYYRPILAILFVISGLINNIRTPSMTIVSAAGHFKNTRSRAILEAVISLLSTILFMKLFGIQGILIGAIITSLYRTTDFIIYASKHIVEKSLITTIRRIIRNLIVSTIFVVLSLKFIPIIKVTIVEWIIMALVVGGIGVGLFVLVNSLFERKATKDIYLRIKFILVNKNKIK